MRPPMPTMDPHMPTTGRAELCLGRACGTSFPQRRRCGDALGSPEADLLAAAAHPPPIGVHGGGEAISEIKIQFAHAPCARACSPWRSRSTCRRPSSATSITPRASSTTPICPSGAPDSHVSKRFCSTSVSIGPSRRAPHGMRPLERPGAPRLPLPADRRPRSVPRRAAAPLSAHAPARTACRRQRSLGGALTRAALTRAARRRAWIGTPARR